MFVTPPTSQVERSPLKSPAPLNTAPHNNKEKSKDKNGLEKKEERALFKNIINASKKGRKEKRSCQKKTDIEEGEKEYVLAFMVVTFPTSHVERSLLKAPA